eukprot:1770754-Pleurochrysis_carterae.AAC.1
MADQIEIELEGGDGGAPLARAAVALIDLDELCLEQQRVVPRARLERRAVGQHRLPLEPAVG